MLCEQVRKVAQEAERLGLAENGDDAPSTAAASAPPGGVRIDRARLHEELAVKAVRDDADLTRDIAASGVPWGRVKKVIFDMLPDTLDGRDDKAYQLVAPTLTRLYGQRDQGWHTFKRGEKNTTCIKKGPKPDDSSTQSFL